MIRLIKKYWAYELGLLALLVFLFWLYFINISKERALIIIHDYLSKKTKTTPDGSATTINKTDTYLTGKTDEFLISWARAILLRRKRFSYEGKFYLVADGNMESFPSNNDNGFFTGVVDGVLLGRQRGLVNKGVNNVKPITTKNLS